jgi:hypothetical protein
MPLLIFCLMKKYMSQKLGDKKPTIVPVHAEEAQGKNQIPIAFAAIGAVLIGL